MLWNDDIDFIFTFDIFLCFPPDMVVLQWEVIFLLQQVFGLSDFEHCWEVAPTGNTSPPVLLSVWK